MLTINEGKKSKINTLQINHLENSLYKDYSIACMVFGIWHNGFINRGTAVQPTA